jgi:hypothetical protein
MKGVKEDWDWTPDMEGIFVDLKERLTTTSILSHPSSEPQCIVQIVASDSGLGSVISQKGGNDKLHPIPYHSSKFLLIEINYEIH